MITGIDISAWQGQVDFAKVANESNTKFVYAKASQGTSEQDSEFHSYHTGCKENGIPFGPYHFFEFNTDPIAQAKNFLAVIDGYEGQLLPMVDVEGGGQNGATDLNAMIKDLATFNQAVQSTLNGKGIIIYTDYGDWNGMMQGTDAFSGHKLWLAEYNHDTSPTLPTGWSNWSIWQWTSGGIVSGIPGFVDLDRLNGDDLTNIYR